jgi:hypothetical protein
LRDVSGGLDLPAPPAHDPRPVRPLEYVTLESVDAIESVGVKTVDPMHRRRDVGARGFQEQVVVVVHQAVRVAPEAIAIAGVRKNSQERMPVIVIQEDVAAEVAPRRYVVDDVGDLYTAVATHANQPTRTRVKDLRRREPNYQPD